MSVLKEYLRVTMPDGSVWSVPVLIIAEHRAAHYEKEFSNLKESLEKDTSPLFEESNYEIEDWAKNNMNWKDVEPFAQLITHSNTDYQEGWMNGPKRIF